MKKAIAWATCLSAGVLCAGTAAAADGVCTHTPKQNKEIVIGFYNALARGDVATLQKLGRPDYRQHNPNYGDTLQGLVDNIHARPARAPDAPPVAPLVFVRSAAEGDYVVLLRRMGPMPGTDPTPEAEKANVDWFRVQDCKVAEHWDYQELFPRAGAANPPKNNNGRF